MHTSINIKRHNSRWLLYGHSIGRRSLLVPFGMKCYDDSNGGNSNAAVTVVIVGAIGVRVLIVLVVVI